MYIAMLQCVIFFQYSTTSCWTLRVQLPQDGESSWEQWAARQTSTFDFQAVWFEYCVEQTTALVHFILLQLWKLNLGSEIQEGIEK